jgi:hypothetical protein
VLPTLVASDRNASSVATASPTWSAVAMLRRRRRVTPRRPICVVRGRKRARRSTRSRLRSGPVALPAACSVSASGRPAARRIAGSAASGGPITPSAMLAMSTGRSTLKVALIANSEEAKYDVSAHESRIPSTAPAIAPSAPSSAAVRMYTRRICSRPAPIAFIVAISGVCSPISVVIVLESSTSAPIRASSVTTKRMLVRLLKRLLPGQSPGVRISGRSLKPLKPGTVCRYCRIVVTVWCAAAREGSRRRKASRV